MKKLLAKVVLGSLLNRRNSEFYALIVGLLGKTLAHYLPDLATPEFMEAFSQVTTMALVYAAGRATSKVVKDDND